MPELNFEVRGAEIAPFTATPTLIFKLHIANIALSQEPIYSILLRCQIQIAAPHRRYGPSAQARLLEVFGTPERWQTTLHPLLWTQVSLVVPQFSEQTLIDLPILCTYDLDVVSTKYFNALEEGNIPLTFLFSGTIFYENQEGNLQIQQIPWSQEASFSLLVTLWQEMIASYYPQSSWLRLRKDVLDQLQQYKAKHGFPSWEEALGHLLQASNEEVRS
ncbi:hypothetical protein EPA93_43890 [Ktedonosporobacter rubrisoli]|uniref:Uncharacterized protein n=1 Tax=Ktedonosporobacter rubrisoli TaxID=2509675 RepID=A0A4P6K2T9_KTERU|nr:DUF6084 family protein [Ktedonosporobacter rubrisoli]QBD82548.1 hypothetical protein EPA93_43890 [Ktedonosporobacter rubrisoli]